MENETGKAVFSPTQRLHECGLRPTLQRVAVFSYLCNYTSHPTADILYADLVSAYPTLSRTTIYQTLHALHKCGLVTKVESDGEMRFDVETSFHGHFRCTQCGKIFNIFYQETATFPQPPSGFMVKETSLFYHGICPLCNSKPS